MAELIGRIINTSKILLPSSLKDYISLYDSIDSRQCVGLTKNNLLIEFDILSEKLTRVHKISAAADGFFYESLKVIHDVYNQYQVVVTQSSNQGLQVYKTASKPGSYEMIFELRETFIEIEVDDEPTKGAYEVLKIKLSPSRILVKDFSSSSDSFLTIDNDCGLTTMDNIAEHEFNDAAEVALLKQSEHLNQAIQVVEKDLKKLKQLISDLTHNLSADVQTVKESDLLKATFSKKLLPSQHLKSDIVQKNELVIQKIKSFDAKQIVITIGNPLDGKIEDLKPVLNHPCFRFKETHFLNLDQKIQAEACELIMDKMMGFDVSNSSRKTIGPNRQKPKQTVLDPGETITFVLDLMEVIETDIQIFFQFYYNGQLFVQSLKVNLANKILDEDSNTAVEKFLVDLMLYNFKESFHVKSHLERPFDLFLAVKSSGVAETKTSSKIAFSGTDVTVVIFKLDKYAYRLDIYSDEISSIKRSLVKLYEKLPEDCMIIVKRPPLLDNYLSIDKKTALVQEITALKKEQKIDEIVTDLAFFT